MKDESISWNEEAVKNINGLCSSRMERGITAKELAQLSNVAANCICTYERGQRLPSVKNYNKLARFFGWRKISGSQPRTYKKLEELPPAKPVTLSHPREFSFDERHIYQIYTTDKQEKEPVKDCVFRYEGKQGIHHVFREIRGNWTRTYTDAQLIGKKVKEVDNE